MSSLTRPLVAVRRLGRVDYGDALRVQETLLNSAVQQIDDNSNSSEIKVTQDVLLLCEHNPVYTNGRRAAKDADDENLRTAFKKLGADYYQVNRGGLVTFHGPGQLVCYPILNLHHFKPSLKWYVNTLEEVVIETCRKFGIETHRTPDTGIWHANSKVCAMGIQSTRRITMHGLALNCNTDLNWFTHIVPCGLHGKGVTSLSELTGRQVTVEEATEPFLASLEDIFKCKLVEESDTAKQKPTSQ